MSVAASESLGVFYTVKDPISRDIVGYLFGTVHQIHNDPKWDIPAKVEKAFRESTDLLVEFDIFGSNLDAHCPTVKNQIEARRINVFRDPDAAGSDIRLTYEAHQTGMHVGNLENIDDTVAGANKAAKAFGDKQESIPESELMEMVNLYLTAHRNSDENVIDAITRFFCATEEVYKLVVLDRNIVMADSYDQKLRDKERKGPVFGAPGAGHIGGGAGMAQLLRQKDWIVEKQ